MWCCGLKRVCEEMSEQSWKPSDDLPNKKIINTELFIDRTAAHYIGET